MVDTELLSVLNLFFRKPIYQSTNVRLLAALQFSKENDEFLITTGSNSHSHNS